MMTNRLRAAFDAELEADRRERTERWCRVYKAEARAFTYRNLFCLTAVAWFGWATWPWLCGFAQIAQVWGRKLGL